jgi:hypothetical protein
MPSLEERVEILEAEVAMIHEDRFVATDGYNPALLPLEPLIGRWSVTVSNASFLDDPQATMSGRTTLEWVGGAFVAVHSLMDDDGPPNSYSVIGRSESSDGYSMLYYDNRGVSRIYAMTFDGTTWTQERHDPDFYQRFTGTLSEDGRTIAAAWEKSDDEGATWQHDFDVTYARKGA